MTTADAPLTKKDFKSAQDVRWCPGCGDYGILNSVQSAFAKIGKPLHETVVISGIGCSSRFPYYMQTYGFHTIHGRAPALATGMKLAKPELDVWVVTGDGDGLSIGGNHLIHALRRNVGLKILLFNNRIYGLTKGQFSPTSVVGQKTKSTPMGAIDAPFRPITLALGAGATFVARSVDVFGPHLEEMVLRAAAHEGTALVEIYQNCNIFNDGAFKGFTEKSVRDDRVMRLEHGKPVPFGPEENRRGVALGDALLPRVVPAGDATAPLVWDEKSPNIAAAMALAQMDETTMPVPIGVFRDVERPSFEGSMLGQVAEAQRKRGDESLDDVLTRGDTWTVG